MFAYRALLRPRPRFSDLLSHLSASCCFCSSLPLAVWLLPDHTQHVPVSEPLCSLFPLPEGQFPAVCRAHFSGPFAGLTYQKGLPVTLYKIVPLFPTSTGFSRKSGWVRLCCSSKQLQSIVGLKPQDLFLTEGSPLLPVPWAVYSTSSSPLGSACPAPSVSTRRGKRYPLLFSYLPGSDICHTDLAKASHVILNVS